ncbi:MAG: Ig-like domain-containing protein [Spirochaetes bacterium]|nr:Ig-like domain-containing protein [Spirochaetota bacterium]
MKWKLSPRVSIDLLGALWIGLISCKLVDFRDVSGIHTYPSEPNTVVSNTDRIWVSFPFPPDPASAEALFQVKDFMGTVPGRFAWDGNTLYFLPEPELIIGARYTLSFSGTLRDSKGHSYEKYVTVPFFYQYKSESSPYIQSVTPSRGEIVSGNQGIVITFNQEMDPSSFEKGFSLSPRTPYEVRWSNSDRTVQVSPQKKWEDRTLYNLTFGEGITGREGIPLAPTQPTTFLVQEDTDCPYVRSVEVALDDGVSFPPIGTDLDALLHALDPIRITFSEPMDTKKTRSAIRIIPALPGIWTWLDDRVLLFLPTVGWESGVSYTLQLGNSAEDCSGNPILPFTPLSFTPQMNPLTLEILLAEDGILLHGETCSPSQSIPLSLSPPAWSDYTFRFTFLNGSFLTDAEKLSVQKRIQLTCIFPPSAASPIPQGYSWVGGNQLSITYTGLSPSTITETYYYLLTLKGGDGGICTTTGRGLSKDLKQLFVTGRR